ncbi:hypothetical protein FIE12Z_1512 [Fusarium flagelliforme]|uniref:Uncharacterized protein n=1 Tax=Fusarium flagelliforme TaxID=2675880 RepID=A0A395N320_9HYPO|nr:hypothetical protein FIE12Z_1512 [Fusarium flagelliforme]
MLTAPNVTQLTELTNSLDIYSRILALIFTYISDRFNDMMEGLHRELEDARAEKAKYERLLNQSLERERRLIIALEKCQNLHGQNGDAVDQDALRPPPDKLFVDKLLFLRQNIREFTYQYFNSWLPSAKISSNSIQEIARILNMEPFALFRTPNPSGTRENKRSNAAQSSKINRPINTLAGVTATVKRIELLRAVNTIWAYTVEFSILMHTQGQGFELYYGSDLPSSIQIDDNSMEVPGHIGTPSGSTVNLIMEPTLRRAGESEGGYVSQAVYLVKLAFTCETECWNAQDKIQMEKKTAPGPSRITGTRWRFMKRGYHS